MVIPSSVDYRGDVLAHASGDRRIITSAFVVGLIVCSALIATRNRADDHPQRSGASVRITFDVSLLRNDAFGRHHERVLPVTMIIANRDGEVRASAVALGELRRR